MYAVIFTAELNEAGEQYIEMAKRMRSLALNEYGCIGFTSVTEGIREISISYWRDKSDIKKWKNNKEHQVAQKLGREKWYSSYRVEIVEVLQEYSHSKSQ